MRSEVRVSRRRYFAASPDWNASVGWRNPWALGRAAFAFGCSLAEIEFGVLGREEPNDAERAAFRAGFEAARAEGSER